MSIDAVCEHESKLWKQITCPNGMHTQTTSPDGPFSFKEVLFDTFHHNPRLVRLPTGGFLLYMIGGKFPIPNNTECQDLPHTKGEDLDTRILVSFSSTLNGPWSPPQGPLLARGRAQDWDYIVTNPSPIILENGMVLLYYRGMPK